jgi:hypothetical protein
MKKLSWKNLSRPFPLKNDSPLLLFNAFEKNIKGGILLCFRRFDFPNRKAQHGLSNLDKEVFCDFLLGVSEPTIERLPRTALRPPGVHHHEGVLVSATAICFDKTSRHFTCLGRRPR